MKPWLLALTLGTVGCAQPVTPVTPHPVTGTSVIVDSESTNACIRSLLPQSLKDANVLTGTLDGAALTVTDQFHGTYAWTGTTDGRVYQLATLFPDPWSGPCGVTEHVLSSTLVLTRSGDGLTGQQVTHYRLLETGESVTDTSAYSLTVH